MKKNSVLYLIAVLLCFLVGYAAFMTVDLVRTLIADSQYDCRSDRNAGCSENGERPVKRFRGR